MSIVSIHDFYPDENVRTNPQHLSERQKEQVRQNIGAMAADAKIPGNFMNLFAPIIHASESGEVISTDIVAAESHTISCKVSGSADPTAVTVLRYGKNLLDPNVYSNKTGIYILGNQEIRINEAAEYFPFGQLVKHRKYVVSCEKLSNKDSRLTTFYLKLRYEDGSLSKTFVVPNGAPFQIESDPEKTLIGMNVPSSNIGPINANILKGLMVSVTAGAYVPFIEAQVARAADDGSVSGLTSISPSMTLITNSPGVTIYAGYDADTKGYIDREIRKIQKSAIETV